MPIKIPPSHDQSTTPLQALGEQLRVRRKGLRVSSTAAAEAAGMSRVTLHRIEKGEPSVAGGAWANAAAALGMTLMVRSTDDAENAKGRASPTDLNQWIPVRVQLADYPQLKALAWQVHGTDTLSPLEALGIYERNARHLDIAAMAPAEQALLQALRAGLGGGAAVVGQTDV
jgi:transcriptional regulator with XRE-family HTH domain